MASRRRNERKQVRLTILDNEPMARLAEQRLRQEGVPCMVRSLQGGPGLWGSAYNLPHGLYVYQSDVMRAREVLDLPPLEVAEREAANGESGHRAGFWLIVAVIAVVLLLIIAAPALAREFWLGVGG